MLLGEWFMQINRGHNVTTQPHTTFDEIHFTVVSIVFLVVYEAAYLQLIQGTT